jgi:NAD(P)-dependent dehydrogenase (short-subunit alcohol dehydrogenase family)
MLEFVHLDRAEPGLGEDLHRLLASPHGAEPLAALLGQRHGHAVHARHSVEQGADGVVDILVHMAGAVDVLRQVHPVRGERAADALADMFTATIEGAFIMSKTLREPKLVAAQIRLYLDFVELLFAGD